MIAIETLLFGVVAGLLGLKLVLLAVAAVLFVNVLMQRARQRRMVRAPKPVRRPGIDVHA